MNSTVKSKAFAVIDRLVSAQTGFKMNMGSSFAVITALIPTFPGKFVEVHWTIIDGSGVHVSIEEEEITSTIMEETIDCILENISNRLKNKIKL